MIRSSAFFFALSSQFALSPATAAGNKSAQFAARLQAESEKWGRIVRASGAQLD